MNGGSMTTLSRISMAAVAALFVGMTPATAADLGGNCCADLEERVAELEATTARKGTRKVSLTISGQISQQLVFWDDGVQSDTYISGPGTSNSRWRMAGSAKISPEWTAGFLYEFEAFGSSSTFTQANGSTPGLPTQGAAGGFGQTFGDDGGASHTSLREAMAWIESSRLGRVSIGHGSTAANNAILVDLSNKGMAASNYVHLHSSAMLIGNGTGVVGPTGYNGTRNWGNFFNGATGNDWLNPRQEHIQYRTPTIAGFTLGASFGEDNYWDVALRYAGEFNGIRIAGAIGYSVQSEWDRDLTASPFNAGLGTTLCNANCDKRTEQLAGSLSIRHMPTGLFFTGAAGKRDVDNHQEITGASIDATGAFTAASATGARSIDADFFYLSGGVARNFFGIGDTVIYGEYSEWRSAGDVSATAALEDDVLQHWGVGILQNIDAASLELWLAYKNYSLDTAAGSTLVNPDDLHMITAGTRIRF